MDSIITVTAPAASYNLTDLDTVKTDLDIDNLDSDGKLRRWIAAYSQRLQSVCNRIFPVEGITETFRSAAWGPWQPYCGSGAGEALVLSRRPLVTVTSVTDGTTALDASGYEFNRTAGLIYRLASDARSYWSLGKATVVYTAGFSTIPADVEDAVLALIRHRWFSSGRDPGLRRFAIEGVGSEEYWVSLTSGEGELPPELKVVADTIQKYRMVTLPA